MSFRRATGRLNQSLFRKAGELVQVPDLGFSFTAIPHDFEDTARGDPIKRPVLLCSPQDAERIPQGTKLRIEGEDMYVCSPSKKAHDGLIMVFYSDDLTDPMRQERWL